MARGLDAERFGLEGDMSLADLENAGLSSKGYSKLGPYWS